MHSLACADLGTPECAHVTTGETPDEAVEKMIVHAKEAHAAKIEGKSDEELAHMMGEAVKEA